MHKSLGCTKLTPVVTIFFPMLSPESDTSATPTNLRKEVDPLVDSPGSADGESPYEQSSDTGDDDSDMGDDELPKPRTARSNKNGLPREDETLLLETIESNEGLNGSWSMETHPAKFLLTLTNCDFKQKYTSRKINDRIRYFRTKFTAFEYKAHLRDHKVIYHKDRPKSKQPSTEAATKAPQTSPKKAVSTSEKAASTSKTSKKAASASKQKRAPASKKKAAPVSKSTIASESNSTRATASTKDSSEHTSASQVTPKQLFKMPDLLEARFPKYQTCELDEARPTKNNHGALFATYTNKKTPCGKDLISTYSLSWLIDGRHAKMYGSNLLPEGLMHTRPSTAGILCQEKDRPLYESRAKKLRRNRQVEQEDQTNQENALLNDLSARAKTDPDLFFDHILYKFPKKVTHLQATSGSDVVPEIIWYTDAKNSKQKDGSYLNMTSTNYTYTVHVGISGTKKPLNIDTTPDLDGITSEIQGMTLSPS